MSEKTSGDDKLLPITAMELARFHAAKGVKDIKCWMCGHDVWLIQSDEEHPAIAQRWVDSSGNRYPEGGLLTFVLSCENCGTRWSIDYQTVANWLQENPE